MLGWNEGGAGGTKSPPRMALLHPCTHSLALNDLHTMSLNFGPLCDSHRLTMTSPWLFSTWSAFKGHSAKAWL